MGQKLPPFTDVLKVCHRQKYGEASFHSKRDIQKL